MLLFYSGLFRVKRDEIEGDPELPEILTPRPYLRGRSCIIVDKAEGVDPPCQIALWQVHSIAMPVVCCQWQMAQQSPIDIDLDPLRRAAGKRERQEPQHQGQILDPRPVNPQL